jgi:voltage-gated sodium channel
VNAQVSADEHPQNVIRRIVESITFQVFILVMILIAAVLVGLETYPSITARYGNLIVKLHSTILWIFAIEAFLKMAQHGRHFYRYFKDPWNTFDFLVVSICFLPLNAAYVSVVRLARVLRTLKLMTALPQLQILVSALIKSIPSMAYVGLLLSLNFYVYAVIGVFLFGKNDPVHFQNLQTSLLSMFRVVTLEDWTDIMYIQMYGSDVYAYSNTTGIDPVSQARPVVGAIFFVSFVVIATMIMLNLFIGVILNSMDESRADQDLARQKVADKPGTPGHDIADVMKQLDEVSSRLKQIQSRITET